LQKCFVLTTVGSTKMTKIDEAMDPRFNLNKKNNNSSMAFVAIVILLVFSAGGWFLCYYFADLACKCPEPLMATSTIITETTVCQDKNIMDDYINNLKDLWTPQTSTTQ